jgi:hypothetical protein
MDELPAEAALREVWQEQRLRVELVGEKRYDIADPVEPAPAGVGAA